VSRIALLPIELNDVSNKPLSPDLPARMKLLTTALQDRLTRTSRRCPA
jgi:hypothetical protein